MAQTTLIPQTPLESGHSLSVSVADGVTKLYLSLRVVKVGSSDCLVRLTAKDSLGLVIGGARVFNTDTQELTIQEIPSAVLIELDCLQGSALVRLDRLTGLDSIGAGESAGTIGTADLVDLSVTTGKLAAAVLSADAAGRAKMADGFVNTAKLGASAVTGAKLDRTGMKHLRFDGNNGAGAVTLTGAAVGDRVLFILGVTSASGVSVVGTIPTQFEAVITVINQIQQADVADLSGNDYWVVLFPAAA